MIEKFFDTCIYAARWLLAPLYLGLSLILLAILIKFFQDVWLLYSHLLEMPERDLILHILGMVDLVLVSGLALMVMFSGYENFVSRLEVGESEREKLSWLGKMDADSLKAKLATSIVAISSIHLLRVFMNASNTPSEEIMWYVIVHLTFVVSAVGMAFQERLLKRTKKQDSMIIHKA